MAYITAIEASRHIGVGERTVRLWISQGKLKAEKIAVNRLAIDEREVDRIAKERSKYRDSRQERYDSKLYERIEELEKKVALLSDKIAMIEGEKESKKVKSVSVSAAVSGDDLPPGCVLARDFAKQHGVTESTFRGHINAGIRGDRVEAEKSAKGRYLTPAQQTATLEFWDRHGVKYTP